MSVASIPTASRELDCGYDGAVFVSCFYGWPSRRVLAALSSAQAEHRRSYPRGYSLSIVPDFGTDVDASSVRQEASRDELVDLSVATGTQFESTTVANAMVIQAKGMVGVMIRTFMATMMLNPRMRMKVSVCRTLEEAEAHFRTIPDGPPVPERLTADIETWLRSKRTPT